MLQFIADLFSTEVFDFFISKILVVLAIVVVLRFAKKIMSMI